MTDASVRRTIVTVVTYGLLGLAFVLGVIWFFWPENSRWEPAVNSLTLVAGLTGIFVDRLSRESERRRGGYGGSGSASDQPAHFSPVSCS